MNHSESEMCVLRSSIEKVKPDRDFERSLNAMPPSNEASDDRRRITILNQAQDYSAVFDRAHDVIAVMRDAYEEMFTNWKLESELNSGLDKKILELQAALETQKKVTKKLLDDKSTLQEELERRDRRPRFRSKAEGLETEMRVLKKEVKCLKATIDTKDSQLEEKNKKLSFYREEFGVSDKGKVAQEQDTFRPRTKALRRAHSVPEERRVTKPLLGSKLISFLSENIK